VPYSAWEGSIRKGQSLLVISLTANRRLRLTGRER